MNGSARRCLVAVGGALLAIAGCAIQPDSGPRDVPDDHEARVAIGTPVEGAEAQGSGRIYLIASEGSTGRLRTVLRDPKGQEELMETLIDGPNEGEVSDGLSTVIPSDLAVNSVRFEGGVVNVDVSDVLEALRDSDLQLAVAQIVFTLSELPGVESVVIRVDGNSRSWPDGDGDLQSDPLTVYDFIGFAESSQPAYPVTPRNAATSTTAPPSTVPASTAAASTAPSTTTG
jgi:hypothetical protein